MLKKYWLFIIIVLLLVSGGIFIKNSNKDNPALSIESQCEVDEMVFYYLDQCSWCQKIKNEGTISKIEELGIKVKKVNAKVGPISHEFTGVPTFVIAEKVYSGYRTFEELKEMLGCLEE